MIAQPGTLLATKLYVPPRRIPFVPRSRLVERLQAGLCHAGRLSLISAPAGYGKTMLVVEWLHQESLPAAWLSLDEGDNDFVRFVRYLVAALRSPMPEVGEASLKLLTNAQIPAVEGLLTPLVNELVDMKSTTPALLVLDDVHLIQAQAVHDALTFLVEYLPPQIHLVLVTRADPPLPLARWRGRGQLNELRLDDLRFSPAETAAYLDLALKMHLSPTDLEILVARSEGWIAGLQMAAASLHGRDDAAAFMQALSGSQRNILDYLLEEVLVHLPAGRQDFLIKTSFLDRLCGPLCDAILDQAGISQSMLESLERTNLFIIPLDDQRIWYRYHHLFADLLQTRLYQRLEVSRLAELRLRACQWYQDHSLLPEAVELALQAEDFERAAALVVQAADDVLKGGELFTFKRWIERLPAVYLRSQPTLCIYQAWALLWEGSPLEMIAACLQPLKDADLQLPGLLTIKAIIALYQGDIPSATQYAHLALEQLQPREAFMRSMATMILGSAAQLLNEEDRSMLLHDQAIQDGLSSGNLLLSISMLSSLANQLQKEGRLRLAEDKYQQALRLASDANGHYLPIATRPLVGLASIALERNQLSGIEAQLLQGVQLSEAWGAMALIQAYLMLARAQICLGKLKPAQDCIDTARRQARQFDLTEMDDLSVEFIQTRLWLLQADYEQAQAWAIRRGLWEIDPQGGLQTSDFTNAHMRKYEYPVLARLYFALGKTEEALTLLDALVPHAQAAHRPVLVIEALLLRALLLQSSGQISAAYDALEDALSLAEPEGYIRLFLDEGPSLQALLQKLIPDLKTPRLMRFARTVLLAFSPAEATEPAVAATLPETLSGRELEVLHLLVETSLSAEEIAERLFVSVHTVRSHIKSIYSKLDVHGRMEAASRARELHLVGSPS